MNLIKTNENDIECIVKLNRPVYPKTISSITRGDWGMLAMDVIEVVHGNPKLSKYKNLTVKGNLPDVQYDIKYTFIGTLTENEYGAQYEIKFLDAIFDFTKTEDQRSFLGMVLTESQVNLLFDHFDNPCELLEDEKNTPLLLQVHGIGKATAHKLFEKYNNNKKFANTYIALAKCGLSQSLISRLLEVYGSGDVILNIILNDPYRLIRDVRGIGWNTADEIAIKNGRALDSIDRIAGYMFYYMEEGAENGYSWLSPWEVMNETQRMLSVDSSLISEAFRHLIEIGVLWHNEDKSKVALQQNYSLELAIANELKRLINSESKVTADVDTINEVLKQQEEKQGWEFTEEQKEGIIGIILNNVSIITGKAGVGKSSLVAGALKVLHNFTFKQTALAGRAADRLREVTGQDGYTIHRLLEYNPRVGFVKNQHDQLPDDIIILDETSMVGGLLFWQLIRAIPNGSKLVMLGDDAQLPSIGKLNIFKDMLDSPIVPTTRLTKIHRQASKSAIITESLKVSEGIHITPKLMAKIETRGELQDLTMDIYKDSAYTAFRVFEHYKAELPKVDNNPNNIQVILPMKSRGDASVLAVNKKIQDWYNPNPLGKVSVGDYELRIGDKVIVRKNNRKDVTSYPSEEEIKQGRKGSIVPVFNGNLGTITDIEDNDIMIDLNGFGELVFPKNTWKSIELGYAITCHSFQGSSAKTVIVGLDYSAYNMLSREWLYTALTRAEKKCILCAENSALRQAIETSNVPFKQTFLQELLQLENKEDLINLEEFALE